MAQQRTGRAQAITERTALDELIEFWKSATDKARTKELALVCFGFWCGLRIAKETVGEKHDAILAPDRPKG